MRKRFHKLALAVVLLVPVGLVLGCYGWAHFQYRAAQKALARKDFAEAHQYLTRCLKVWSGSATVHLEAARAARKAGTYDEAERHLRAGRHLGGEAEAIELEHLLLHAQRDDLARVESQLVARLNQNHPDTVLILEVLTPCYVKTYQLTNAQECVRRWLEREPDRLEAWLWQGQVCQWLRNHTEALASYRRVVELDPENDDARLMLGGLLAQGHDPKEALAQFDHVRRRQGDTPAVLKGMARCRRSMNQPEEARRLLEALLAERPADSGGLAERGRLALEYESVAEAVKWFRRAADVAPSDREVSYSLYQCLERLGEREAAQEVLARFNRIEEDLARLEQLSRAISRTPHDPALRCEAGVIMLRNGMEVEGLRWLESALQENPAHGATHQALADHYEGHGEPGRAAYHRGLVLRSLGPPGRAVGTAAR